MAEKSSREGKTILTSPVLNKNKHTKSLWVLPWGYPESFLIALALLAGTIGIEVITGTKAPQLTWPSNFAAIVFLANSSLLLHMLSRKYHFFRWFYSIPASIVAILLFVAPSLLMALIQQKKTDSLFFLYDVTSSWTYYIGVIFFLLVLGCVTIKRIIPLTKKNIGFLLNHFGLWLCIASAHLGSGDMQKLSMVLHEGEPIWYATNGRHEIQELDFAIKLKDFTIDEYPSKIAIASNNSGDIVTEGGKPILIDSWVGATFQFQNYSFEVLNILMSSAPVLNRFEPISEIGATQSAQLIFKEGSATDTFWISSSSILYPQKAYQLDSNYTVFMLKPEPKRFVSAVTVFEKEGTPFDTILEVNKPFTIGGWKIYQTSYDETMGKWSTQSMVELIKDPWLPLVYTGFLLMIGGTFYFIWTGKRKENK